MKTIAVLLTVFNRKKETLNCLQNLFEQVVLNGYTIEVYLVDDACTDGTPEAVNKLFPQVNVINGSGDLFWNRGMHLAWTTATKIKDYDFYLWLNDDTLLNDKALNILLQTSEQFQYQSIIVGATSDFQDEGHVTYGGRTHTKGLLESTNEPLVCDYFNGNIVLITKEVYNKVGMHDPVFHHALGDFDYGLRAAKLGVKSYVAPGVLGQCDVHTSLSTWCNPKESFKKRWKAFRSPLGNNPEEFYVFQKRHKGILKALISYMSNHTRVVLPVLWK